MARSYNKKTRYQLKKDKSSDEAIGFIIKVLLITIIPVILNTAIYNLSSIVDKFIFSNMMVAKGMETDLRDSLIGMYSGKYWLIVNIPIALSSALASSLIPSIVSSKAKKDRLGVISKIRQAIGITCIVAFPCAAGIGFLGGPIIKLLFPNSDDPEKIAIMLSVGCLTVVFYCLSTITNSILQGIDKMRLPVIHSAISLAVNIGLLYLLLAIFDMDVFAWIIADMVFALLMCILNARSLRKYLDYKQEIFNTFVKPIIASLVMGVVSGLCQLLIHNVLGKRWDVIISIIIAVAVYAVMIFILFGVDEKKLKAMPGGGKIYSIMNKLHLIK